MVNYSTWETVIETTGCGAIILGTIVGNVLVCTAVAIVHKLRTPSNLLIVSLAVADLLVAVLVMPLAVAYEVMGQWVLGETICDVWTSLDVMLCTASILNLCVICVDRYLVITRPFQYAMKRTPLRMMLMIMAVWLLAALISIPPLFGWKTESEPYHCIITQAIGYQVYATVGAFYLPLTVMIVIYGRIYRVSSRISKADAKTTAYIGDGNCSGMSTPLRKDSQVGQDAILLNRLSIPNGHAHPKGAEENGSHVKKNTRFKFRRQRSQRPSFSRERKATKTLGIIMGSFIACWLPFFILALIKPLCEDPDTCIPHWLNSVFLWLGYTNSFLNPIIYARFNRDFRTPFREILMLRCRGINGRLRSESYAEQYGSDSHRDCTKMSNEVVTRYQSQGRTIVKLTNDKLVTKLLDYNADL